MKKVRGAVTVTLAYLFLAVVAYIAVLFYQNYGLNLFEKEWASTLNEWSETIVDIGFGYQVNLLILGIVFIIAIILAVVFGTVTNKKLRYYWNDNVINGIFYFASWLPYFPVWLIITPFKLICKLWESDASSIVFCVLAYICVAVSAYLLYVIYNYDGFSDSASEATLVELIFGIELSLGTIAIVMEVCFAVYAISITIAHYKFKETWDYSIAYKIFNVFTWIAFIPVVIVFLPISFIVFCASLGGSSSSGSSSSSSSYYGGSNSSSDSYSSTPSYDYSVLDNYGHTRYLTRMDYKSDIDYDSPFNGRYYIRCRDDIGQYWRSYDNGSSFIKETYEQTSRGW